MNVSLAQRTLDWFIAAFLSLPASMLEAFGVRVRCFGDAVALRERGEFCVLLSNHPTTADWMFLWNWLFRYGDLTQLKIVLKGGLRAAPVIGWALQMACHLFLARDWERDQRHVQRLVHHYCTAMRPASGWVSALFAHVLGRPSLQLLIFPEGTNLRPAATARSNAFAKERGLGPYVHVLHPRTTGFTYIMRELTAPSAPSTASTALQAVYDLTVAFPESRIRDIGELFQGHFPSTIAVHCRRFAAASLPKGDEALAGWLQSRYQEKERMLTGVYGGRGVEALGPELPATSGRMWLALRMILAGWVVFAVLGTWVMLSVWWVKWWCLSASVAFGVLSYLGGGDAMVLMLEEWRQKGTQQQRTARTTHKTQ